MGFDFPEPQPCPSRCDVQKAASTPPENVLEVQTLELSSDLQNRAPHFDRVPLCHSLEARAYGVTLDR